MDKTALFWLLNLNNFDKHPVWLRSNQFSADCHYWQCHSVKSQKVGIIYYDFPSVHARSRWTESRTLIGWSRGPDIFSGQIAFSSGPLKWWPFELLAVHLTKTNNSNDNRNRSILHYLVFTYSTLKLAVFVLHAHFLLIFGSIFPHLFTSRWVSNNCRC